MTDQDAVIDAYLHAACGAAQVELQLDFTADFSGGDFSDPERFLTLKEVSAYTLSSYPAIGPEFISRLDGTGGSAADSVAIVRAASANSEWTPVCCAPQTILVLRDSHWERVDADSVRVRLDADTDITRTLARAALPMTGESRGHVDKTTAALMILAVAADSLGIARRALADATAYARSRQQFGSVIGAYQAVSHACVDAFLDTEAAAALQRTALQDIRAPDALLLGARRAKIAADRAARNSSTTSIQTLGGRGMRFDTVPHQCLRRAIVNAQLQGSRREHLAAISAWDAQRTDRACQADGSP